MWQGSVIDWIVTNEILPYYQKQTVPNYSEIAENGVRLAKRQFEFSKNRFYHDPDISKGEVGADWTILDIHESNVPFEETQIEEVYKNIREILLRFPTYQSPSPNKNMEQYLLSARFLRADAKSLKYQYERVKIQPQIDLVSYLGRSMHVIDWKVVERDDADYSRQLQLAGIVALHFSREKYKQEGWKPMPDVNDVRLFEFNLMSGKFKEHIFNKDAAANALDTVMLLSDEQEELSQSRIFEDLEITDYERTNKVETCAICNFKLLCKHILLNDLSYDEGKYIGLVQNKELERHTI